MIYIDKKPNPSGAYPNPKMQPFRDCIALPDDQVSVFFEYNGFVTIKTFGGRLVAEPNTAAWESWKASLTEEAE